MVSAFRAISSTSSQNENKKVARPCGLENPTPARQTPQSLPLIRPLAARLRRQSIYWSRKQSPPPPVSALLSLPARSAAPHRSFRLPSHRAGPGCNAARRPGRCRRSQRWRAVVCAAPWCAVARGPPDAECGQANGRPPSSRRRRDETRSKGTRSSLQVLSGEGKAGMDEDSWTGMTWWRHHDTEIKKKSKSYFCQIKIMVSLPKIVGKKFRYLFGLVPIYDNQYSFLFHSLVLAFDKSNSLNFD